MSTHRNPYELGPVDNPRLLRTRSLEARALVGVVAPTNDEGSHAFIVGEDRTGRTSLLREVTRRAASDRDSLIVDLRLVDDDLTSSGVTRALLTGTVESLVSADEKPEDWYLAWCDRVHLRDRSPMSTRDALVSGLAFAADSAAILDPSVLERDLRTLRRLAGERGKRRIVVCIDDADEMLEDVALTERLIEALDAAHGWTLLMATGPPSTKHLAEAVSPCLRRIEHITTAPFWSLDKIGACLTAPLDADAAKRLVPDDNMALLVDLLRLTGGNPFEIALVAHHLWLACRMGEQEHYELTPRVLERVLGSLALYTGAEQDLVDGARAVRELDPGQIGHALDLVALSQLTTRQIAIARLLGVPNDDDVISERILASGVDDEHRRVVEELEELERRGVVALNDEGRFTVQGGRPAAIALKYQARSFLGAEAAEKPFDIPFLACVGEPLAQEYARRTRKGVPGAARLAWIAVVSPSTTAGGARLRAALNAQPFSGLEVEAVPFDRSASERMSELVASTPKEGIALVDFTLAVDGEDLDWVEVWEVPGDVEAHNINEALSDALDDWQPLMKAAEVAWHGSHAVLLGGSAARQALLQLLPHASGPALGQLWEKWLGGDRIAAPMDALQLMEVKVEALRAHRIPDWERGWELSGALSRLGFLLSLCEERLDEARDALLQSQERGPADGWVTAWNLANIAIRQGDLSEARTRLEGIEKAVANYAGVAYVTFFVPGRPAKDTVVTLGHESGPVLLALLRTLVDYLEHGDDEAPIREALAACTISDEQAVSVAKWVADALPHPASAHASGE